MTVSECLNILKQLIKLNSENPPGNTRANIEWIENWANINNIAVETQWYEENKGNIILTLGEADKTIVLCGHLDTVPIGDPNSWNVDPLGAEEKDGYIYGRGAADMKAGVAACLGALKRIKNSRNKELDYKIAFLGTSDEEVGLEGAKAALNSGIMKSAEFLIIAEPTALRIGIAEKGVLWLSIQAYGKAAHGSTPEKGINAIEKLVNIIPLLHSELPTVIDPILGKSTLNIGKIKGGRSVNVVPEYAEVHCDYRLVPSINPEEFANNLLGTIQQHSQENAVNFEMKIEQIMPAIFTSKENYFIKHFLTKCTSKDFIGLNYATDGAVLVKNIPFIIFGPGNPKRIHVANERVPIAQVKEAESILISFLLNLNQLS
ncbi:MAG: M20 family metallopeptidase [Candidatus Hodarchaeota archaeon]